MEKFLQAAESAAQAHTVAITEATRIICETVTQYTGSKIMSLSKTTAPIPGGLIWPIKKQHCANILEAEKFAGSYVTGIASGNTQAAKSKQNPDAAYITVRIPDGTEGNIPVKEMSITLLTNIVKVIPAWYQTDWFKKMMEGYRQYKEETSEKEEQVSQQEEQPAKKEESEQKHTEPAAQPEDKPSETNATKTTPQAPGKPIEPDSSIFG